MANLNRTYKDDLFRMIFSGKKELLELYNAINGSHYERTEDLTVTTMEAGKYRTGRRCVCPIPSFQGQRPPLVWSVRPWF